MSLAREIMDAKDRWREAGGHGPIEMSREAWRSEHTDFRNEDESEPSTIALGPTGGWCL